MLNFWKVSHGYSGYLSVPSNFEIGNEPRGAIFLMAFRRIVSTRIFLGDQMIKQYNSMVNLMGFPVFP